MRESAVKFLSGIFKEAVAYPVFLGIESLEGDGQADLVHHGGPDRAVLVFSRARYSFWEAELGMSLANGSFGEN